MYYVSNVAIGKRLSAITEMVDILKRYKCYGILHYCFNFSRRHSSFSLSSSLQRLYHCRIFYEWGPRCSSYLYDDLSKHAVAYRSLSLLMRRSPDGNLILVIFFIFTLAYWSGAHQLSDESRRRVNVSTPYRRNSRR